MLQKGGWEQGRGRIGWPTITQHCPEPLVSADVSSCGCGHKAERKRKAA